MVPVQTKRLSVKEKNIAIRGRLAWDTILIADKHRSYASFAEQNNIHLYQLLTAQIQSTDCQSLEFTQEAPAQIQDVEKTVSR